MFFILNNLFVFCFATFLDHTEPTQSVTEQNPWILTSTILPGPYPKVVHLLIPVPDTIWQRNLGHHHSGDEKWRSLRVHVPIHKLWVHENAHRSCAKSVFLVRFGRIFEHVAPRRIFFSRIECASWESSSMQTLSLHPAFHNLGYLFSQELIAMYSIRQLTLLSQLLCPWHRDLRIRCLRTNFSLEIDFPAFKFHGVREFCKMQLRDWKSRVLHHTTVRISSTSVTWNSISTVENVSRIGSVLLLKSPLRSCCHRMFCKFWFHSTRRRCQIPWLFEIFWGCPSRAGSRSKTSEIPIILSGSGGNPESRQGTVL